MKYLSIIFFIIIFSYLYMIDSNSFRSQIGGSRATVYQEKTRTILDCGKNLEITKDEIDYEYYHKKIIEHSKSLNKNIVQISLISLINNDMGKTSEILKENILREDMTALDMYMNLYGYDLLSDNKFMAVVSKMAKQGNIFANLQLGHFYKKKDFSKAIFYYNKSIDITNSSSLTYIGDLYNEQGQYVEAFTYYNKAYDMGDKLAALRLAKYYEEGVFIEKNVKKAVSLYLVAANTYKYELSLTLYQYYKEAKYVPRDISLELHFKWLASLNESGEVRKRIYYKYMLRYMEIRAENFNDDKAKVDTAISYILGRGVEVNMHKAYALMRGALANNYIPAGYFSGILKLQGFGTVRSEAEALKLFKKAKDDYPDARYAYALLNNEMSKDDRFNEIVRASEEGSEKALCYLGNYYFERNEFDTAIKYFEGIKKKFTTIANYNIKLIKKLKNYSKEEDPSEQKSSNLYVGCYEKWHINKVWDREVCAAYARDVAILYEKKGGCENYKEALVYYKYANSYGDYLAKSKLMGSRKQNISCSE